MQCCRSARSMTFWYLLIRIRAFIPLSNGSGLIYSFVRWSGSVGSICFWASRIWIRSSEVPYGSGSFYHQAKKNGQKNPVSFCFVPLKVGEGKNIFFGVLKVTDEKSRIQTKISQIRNTGFVITCILIHTYYICVAVFATFITNTVYRTFKPTSRGSVSGQDPDPKGGLGDPDIDHNLAWIFITVVSAVNIHLYKLVRSFPLPTKAFLTLL